MSDATTTISLFSRASFITLLITLFILRSAAAHSATPIYSWQDASGVITFSDNLANAPSNVQVKVLSKGSSPQTGSETESTQTFAPQLPEPSPRVVTQGEFAIQLVEELGLNDAPTAEEAADLLTSVRIAPRLGEWRLDQLMSPELTIRLRKLTVAAAEMGWIELSPEQVLLAFDTTSALLGLTIPETTGPEETSDSPYPIAEMPPLVSVEAPPPDLYSDYLWLPVEGGFWWGDLLFPGFFVLDGDLFFSHHHHFFFGDRRFGLDSGRIGRQFQSHIMDHQVVRSSALSNSGRVGRSVSSTESRPVVSNRMINPPTRPNPGLMPRVRPSLQSRPVRQYSSPAFSRPRQYASSVSRRFNTGMRGGGYGHASGRGSSRR